MIVLAGAMPIMSRELELTSPDGRIKVGIDAGKETVYTVSLDGDTVIPSAQLGLTLGDGRHIGRDVKVTGVKRGSADRMVASPFYRASEIRDNYNELSFGLAKNWRVTFRAYNDGVAYRFETTERSAQKVVDETVCVTFAGDPEAVVPYVMSRSKSAESFETQFFNSFENTYTEGALSSLDSNRLIFLPGIVEAVPGVKVCFTESDLIDYPGMYLNAPGGGVMRGVFAPRPKTFSQGGHNNLQMLVTEREDHIAEIQGPRSLPWRIAVIADDDVTLASTDLTYLLAAPSRVDDISWIRPGKVAWDWWNNWNIDGVNFESGINNDTYKYYIDFASANGIEYVILDEGWAVNKKADLMAVVPEIDLAELVAYGKDRNVGIILWAGYHAFDRDMENVCRHYSDMGVKGFKVDFMDHDDQVMTDFNRRAAEMCARYHLILDLHGTSKPAGLNRTYPNVLNFEGVNGLEQMKWAPDTLDQVKYDVMIPYLRQVAGPMDYTQGAMRNASRGSYYPSNSEPMSQGTRCRQLALYVVLDSPLNMLCDNPSNYMREPESTSFIAGIPTVWDETVILDGEMGRYIAVARRKGEKWYVGGLTDWTARDIEVDLSKLGLSGERQAVLLRDGANAHRKGCDYRREELRVDRSGKLRVHLAPGGGFVLEL